MSNHLADPSFETGVGWTLGTDCNVNGASRQNNNARTGAWSLRLQARHSAIGPTDTCGFAQQTVSGLVAGKKYLAGIWWKSSGVFPEVSAQVGIAEIGGAVVSWTGNSPSYVFAGFVFTAPGGDLTYQVSQIAGSHNFLQSRFFDDAVLIDTDAPDAAALLRVVGFLTSPGSLSASGAGLSQPGSRLSAGVASRSAVGIVRPVGIVATVRKP